VVIIKHYILHYITGSYYKTLHFTLNYNWLLVITLHYILHYRLLSGDFGAVVFDGGRCSVLVTLREVTTSFTSTWSSSSIDTSSLRLVRIDGDSAWFKVSLTSDAFNTLLFSLSVVCLGGDVSCRRLCGCGGDASRRDDTRDSVGSPPPPPLPSPLPPPPRWVSRVVILVLVSRMLVLGCWIWTEIKIPTNVRIFHNLFSRIRQQLGYQEEEEEKHILSKLQLTLNAQSLQNDVTPYAKFFII